MVPLVVIPTQTSRTDRKHGLFQYDERTAHWRTDSYGQACQAQLAVTQLFCPSLWRGTYWLGGWGGCCRKSLPAKFSCPVPAFVLRVTEKQWRQSRKINCVTQRAKNWEWSREGGNVSKKERVKGGGGGGGVCPLQHEGDSFVCLWRYSYFLGSVVTYCDWCSSN